MPFLLEVTIETLLGHEINNTPSTASYIYIALFCRNSPSVASQKYSHILLGPCINTQPYFLVVSLLGLHINSLIFVLSLLDPHKNIVVFLVISLREPHKYTAVFFFSNNPYANMGPQKIYSHIFFIVISLLGPHKYKAIFIFIYIQQYFQ